MSKQPLVESDRTTSRITPSCSDSVSIATNHSVASAFQEIGECLQDEEEHEWFDGVCQKFNQQSAAAQAKNKTDELLQHASPAKAQKVDFSTKGVTKERRWFQSLFQKFDSYCSRIEEEAEQEEAAEQEDQSSPQIVPSGSQEEKRQSPQHKDRVSRLLVSISRIGEEEEEDDSEKDEEDETILLPEDDAATNCSHQQSTGLLEEQTVPTKTITIQSSHADDEDDITVATSVTTTSQLSTYYHQYDHTSNNAYGDDGGDPNLLASLLEQELISSSVAQRVLRKVDNLCLTRTASWRHLAQQRRMSNTSTASNATSNSSHGLGTMIQQHPRAFGGVWDVDSPGGLESVDIGGELIMDDVTIATQITNEMC